MLTLIVDLVEMVQSRREYAECSGELSVDLSDLAAFISMAKSNDVVTFCLDHAKLENRGKHLRLNMSSANWGQAAHREASASHTSMLRRVLRRQRRVRNAGTSLTTGLQLET